MIQQVSGDILSTRAQEISLIIEKHLGNLSILIYVYSRREKGMQASE